MIFEALVFKLWNGEFIAGTHFQPVFSQFVEGNKVNIKTLNFFLGHLLTGTFILLVAIAISN